MEKISILLPVFNATPWLSACLDSILQQSETNWELLAVDDFSTDKSKDILTAYAQKDTRIRVFSNTEKGIIPALRLALQHSTGQWVTRMDADDLMQPSKLALLKDALLQKGQGHVATGLVQYFAEGKLGEGYRQYAEWINHLAQTGNPYSDIYKECVLPSPCWMLYKKDLLKCGGFTTHKYPEDYDLCFRLYKHNIQPISVPEILHLWRDHARRSSRTMEIYADQRFFDLKLYYFFQLDYFHSRPLVVWGAGKNGKKLAQRLRAKGHDFIWVCNNTNKWGKNIMGVELSSYKTLPTIWQPQILVSVASPAGKKEIQAFLDLHHYEKNYHYFFFV